MSSNIIKLYHANAAKDPDAVLEQAVGELSSVLIIGYSKDDDDTLEARASTNLCRKDLLWMIEKFKSDMLLNLIDED